MTALSPRDAAAFEAFQQAGRFYVPTAVSVSEYDTEHGVRDALAVVLQQISARVEHLDGSDFKTVAFKAVFTDEPLASDPAVYPAAYLEPISSSELDAMQFVPARDADGDDIVTDEWALWKLGEDTGEANVKIFTTTEVEAHAMAQAVRETIAGNIDRNVGAQLPMPVRYLPAPFRDAFPAASTPSCHLTLNDSRGRPVAGAEGGVWTVDIEFAWRATRFTARPRIADFRPFVTVAPEP